MGDVFFGADVVVVFFGIQWNSLSMVAAVRAAALNLN